MKSLIFIFFIFIGFQITFGQEVYVDFEGKKIIRFAAFSGSLDTLVSNPGFNAVNKSLNCARYVRDTALYDHILLYPDTVLENVSIYAGSDAGTPKISMKLFTSAPLGTTINLQLGRKNDFNYPSGIYCEFTQVTTKQNEWENIIFNFCQFPAGSRTLPDQIDKIVVLFNPNSKDRDTIYFDDLCGPKLAQSTTIVKTSEYSVLPAVKLYQNNPNPSKNITQINFLLNSASLVSLELFDVLGNSISLILNKTLKAGAYTVPVDTENFPNGIYFYVLKTEDTSRSMRMIVAK